MKVVEAFSPCHITGFFQIDDKSKDPLYVGSRGSGFSIKDGVRTTVKVERNSKPRYQISVNGVLTDFEVSEHLLNMYISRFEDVKNFRILVDHRVNVPIGAGLGTSGAAALGLSLALNDLFELGMSRVEAAQLAHIAEVECKTGLGTVIAEAYGGFEIRVKAGAPGIGEIIRVPVPRDSAVFCLIFGPLSTKGLLTDNDVCRRVNMLGGKLVDEMVKDPKFHNFMKFSRMFSDHVGLMSSEVIKIFKIMDEAGFIMSMPMFGDGVFTICGDDLVEDILGILHDHKFNGRIILSEID
ncbi:hypothetical protein KEJ49_08220, partial [Candidatus Bathyarchaeota archaeon]|nr:hypothetical protein [Candidatus Bathyarchaeota archaeon]